MSDIARNYIIKCLLLDLFVLLKPPVFRQPKSPVRGRLGADQHRQRYQPADAGRGGRRGRAPLPPASQLPASKCLRTGITKFFCKILY